MKTQIASILTGLALVTAPGAARAQFAQKKAPTLDGARKVVATAEAEARRVNAPGGVIIVPKHPHNLAWGDADGKTLYMTARSGLYRMRLSIPGAGRPAAGNAK
jgi:hypothetical protein